MLNYSIMKISRDETNREPSFNDLGKEAVALIHETLMSGGTSFVKSNIITAWGDELVHQLEALDRKLGGSEDPEHPGNGLKEARLLRSAVDHRLKKISLVSGAFRFGSDQILVDDDVVGEERVRQVQESLITAATRITCVTKLIDSFLTEDNLYSINPGEIVATYARAMGLHVNVAGEIPALESAVSRSHWDAALEEIAWNAQKYGANSITMWMDNGKLCLGNNGRELNQEEAKLASAGVQLYLDEVQDSGGRGTEIIRQLGFSDYKLRPPTEYEKQELGINAVVQFNVI